MIFVRGLFQQHLLTDFIVSTYDSHNDDDDLVYFFDDAVAVDFDRGDIWCNHGKANLLRF